MQEVFGDIAFRSHFPPYGPLLQSLDAADLAHIKRLGLSSLCQIPTMMVNHSLLISLVEWFHSEMKTFYLLMGEMTITPKDNWRILRIPFHGARAVYDTTPRAGTVTLSTVFGREL